MKAVELEFGAEHFTIQVPDHADVLPLPAVSPLADPAAELRRGLREPIGCQALADIIRQASATTPHPRAVIVVSDNTRPVPYRGDSGMLSPLLDALRDEHVEDITILVATGTHHGMNDELLRAMLPPDAWSPGVRILNHDCRARDDLRCLGRTARGTEAWVNTCYLDADIKILSGLVEPHFMAGFSGGRKSICPGLVGIDATQIFHGPDMMKDPRAESLLLDGNPCHVESLEVARMAGCDFLVNVTIDGNKKVTGVFCGDMEAAHGAACERAAETNAVRIPHTYDVVVTHAGFTGLNHYQAAKAACEACKAVTPGGTIILAANHTDSHPVGGPDYRAVLPLLAELGPRGLNERLCASDWTFVPEQWEVQKWAQVLTTLGATGRLVYCAPRLTGPAFAAAAIPGMDGGEGLTGADDCALAQRMQQRALDACLAENPRATVAVLVAGPYGVPLLKSPLPGR